MNAWMQRWLRESRFPGLVLILALLGLWQVSALYWIETPTWPPVTRVLEAWWANTADGTLFKHLLATLWR
ncbi:MAG: hypothetical protein Q7R45_11610, partial [Sulfuricaulis sp.]|nr:hypothetical protein [Sulfuricaulis sp.]